MSDENFIKEVKEAVSGEPNNEEDEESKALNS